VHENCGEIIAVGPGGRDESGKLIPIDLKVGDRVLFGKWSGTEVKLDGSIGTSRVRVESN
jgi:chaperonin GroES